MKGCIVLQRRFAFLGHELAVLLRERGVSEFCGYVHERDSLEFLQKQSDLAYTSLILDEDIQKSFREEKLDLEYLKKFEAEHGNLWSFIGVDRVIRYGQLIHEYPHDSSPYTYEEILRIVQVYAKRLTAFIEQEKPDFVFAYQPGALGTVMLYAIAKRRGIPTLTIVPTVTKNRNVVSERVDRMTWVEEIFKKNLERSPHEISHYNDAKQYVEEFRGKPVVYSEVYKSLIKHGRLKQFDFLSPRHLRRTFNYIRLVFVRWRQDIERQSDYTTTRPRDYFADRIRRKIRTLIGYDDLYDTFEPGASFVFFPMHFEPELSILLLSPFDTNQIEMVKRLGQSVPVGMHVYVKDHPQMTPYRTRSYYKELKKIPNVKLLRPELSSFEIIRQSKFVAIITGSAGWEASIFGKPVITFGEVFYNALPSVLHSKTPSELPALVHTQLTSPALSDETLTRFIAALFEDSAPCDLLKIWEKVEGSEEKRAGLKEFADLIAKKIKIVTA